MKASLFRRSAQQAAAGVPMLMLSMAVLGQVSFPSNPKTMAECEAVAAQLRVIQEQESALRTQKYKEVEAMPYETAGEKYRTLMALIDEQGNEATRIRNERYELEKACRAAARANDQVAETAVRELKEIYDKSKHAYDQARSIYEQIRNSPSETYARRNDAQSASLDSAMSDAKQYILAFSSKSAIVGAIQDASFERVKAQMQQLNGDMAALESAIRSVRAEAPPASADSAVAPLPRRGPSSGAAMFQQAISQAEQDRDRPTPVSGPPQTALERTTSSYDQRIDAARMACASSERNCNTGCMGVAAVGVFSLFAGSSAAAAAAGEQAQQCSNRCEQSKRSCDQQVSALEQEKAQAVAEVTNPAPTGRPVSFAAGSQQASPQATDCQPDQALFQEYVEARNNFLRVIGRPSQPASVFAKYFQEVRLQHMNASPEYLQQQIEVQSKPATITGPQSAPINIQSRIFVQMLRCEVDQRQAAAGSAALRPPQGPSGSQPVAASTGSCKAAYDRQEAEFTAINQRNPNTGAVVPGLQVVLYMTSQRLALLDQLCRGQPQYAEYASMKQSQEGALRSCRQIATNSADCAPRLAW